MEDSALYIFVILYVQKAIHRNNQNTVCKKAKEFVSDNQVKGDFKQNRSVILVQVIYDLI